MKNEKFKIKSKKQIQEKAKTKNPCIEEPLKERRCPDDSARKDLFSYKRNLPLRFFSCILLDKNFFERVYAITERPPA